MKTVLNFLIVGLIFLFSSQVFSQGFNSVYFNDPQNIVAVGDNGKIVRSYNGGQSWARYINGNENLLDVHLSNNFVWISADNGVVLKTSKGVGTIESKPTGVSLELRSIFFIDDNVGFVCGVNGTILKSIDGGNTWTPSNTGISSVNLNSISFKNSNDGVVVGDNGVYYTTSNGGTSWNSVATGTSRNLTRTYFFNDGTATVGEWGTILLKPDGQPFQVVESRTNSDIHGVTGTSLSDVIVAGGGGFIRNNSDDNFFLQFEVNPMQGDLRAIHYFGNLGIAVSKNFEVIIRTTDSGTTWNFTGGVTKTINWTQKLSASNGIGNNLCPHPTNRDAMFVAYGDKVHRSWNRGETWTEISTMSGFGSGTRAHSFYVNPLDTNVWLAAVKGSPHKVIRSTNYGQTWTQVLGMQFSNYGQPLEQDQNNPNYYYFCPAVESQNPQVGFWRSTNMGASFELISQPNIFRSPCDIIVQWGNSNVIFVGDGVTSGGLGTVFKTTDGGFTWEQKSQNQSGSEIPSMFNSAFDTTKAYHTTWSSNFVYRTTDQGDSWSILQNHGSSGWGSDICREDPTTFITSNYGGNTNHLTTNAGANWTSFSLPSTGAGCGVIYMDRSYALEMRTSGLSKMYVSYSNFLTDITVNTNSNIPNEYSLSQNFPNPFNPVTKISFTLPASGFVTMKVYDQLGKEVATLVNGSRNAGNYSVDFDGSKLSSGVYFYRLQTEDFVSTKRMILVK